jgi:hypothetical protein
MRRGKTRTLGFTMTRRREEFPLDHNGPLDTAVWSWFTSKGPHGEHFSWHRDSVHPKRHIEMLRDSMAEYEAAAPGFLAKARLVALAAIKNPHPLTIATGIQVLTVVGTGSDLEIVKRLSRHPDERVATHARTALFERGIKLSEA